MRVFIAVGGDGSVSGEIAVHGCGGGEDDVGLGIKVRGVFAQIADGAGAYGDQ